ncbi:membrane protein [Thermoplasma volcanium GSS1]|uniref:Membrane protein n=1 Tax=Thermoplasma volcanium (strain ATCC 51530 / DSM 4299 / JCM 9571 / NBRC 15438 / GSS1) TaxID=273116 RepID=Q97B21_THEVO|nr:hypothetical protein [Thermoplasma volcanium]BAB59780.1 membrane protein [Thermoplasma volcanium GSS1]
MNPFLSAILSIVNAIVILYTATLSPLWYYIVYYGLNPKFSYSIILKPPGSFYTFYNFISINFYTETLTIASLIFIIAISAMMIIYGVNLLRRALLALLSISLYFVAVRAMLALVLLSYSIYLPFWHFGGINWFSFLNVNGFHMDQGSGNASGVLNFIFLSTYFWALLALLSMLVFREAAMLLLVIVIPLFVGLSFLDTFRKVAIRLISLFVELSFLPVYVLIDLYLAHVFSFDFILELGIIAISPAIPSILFAESVLLGFPLKILDPMKIYGLASLPLEKMAKNVDRLDWSEHMRSEFDYRRED